MKKEDIITIFRVWDKQGSGYVSLPRSKGIDGEKEWKERSFKYPEQKSEIISWIKDSIVNKYNIYWCPTILTKSRRVIESIPKINVLYADLDEISPDNIPQDLCPSVLWQSSKDRYAAVWFLEDFIDSTKGSELNKRLTYFLGADKGGWDLTQVLRIPGLPNFKYNPPSPGKLLSYDENKKYKASHFNSLPQVEVNEIILPEDIDEVDENVNILIYKYIDTLKPKAIKLLLSPSSAVSESDRSETLWELECMLIEAGMSKSEVYTIVKGSVWNKYKGRKDEEKRLKTEIEKAASQTEVIIPKDRGKDRKISVVTYSQLMAKDLSAPKWLIQDWWEDKSHGIIAGEPKTYKSTLTTEIAISVASGQPLFNKYPVVRSGPVLIIQEENSEWLMQDRFAKVANSKSLLGSVDIGGHSLTLQSPEDLPIFMINRQGFNLMFDDDKEAIDKLCKEIKPVLVILDPIYLMFGEIDGNSAKELNGVLQWLLRLSEIHETSLMLVHHFNKGGTSSRGGQRMLGSVTFHAWVQSAIYNRVAEGKKNTITVEREFRSFKQPQDVEMSFDMGEPGHLEYNVEINEGGLSTDDLILTLLSTSEQSVQGLSGSLSIPQKEIKLVVDKLLKIGKIQISRKEDKITYFTLKEVE